MLSSYSIPGETSAGSPEDGRSIRITEYGIPRESWEEMKPDMTWLLGRRAADVQKRDWSWFFTLDDGSVIATESTWRLVGPAGVIVPSEDHDQQFGLPDPVNAVTTGKAQLAQRSVTQFSLDTRTGDLILDFGDVALHVLCLSCGCESWRATHGRQNLYCTGGGKVIESRQEQQ
jgi:hypothetical protein